MEKKEENNKFMPSPYVDRPIVGSAPSEFNLATKSIPPAFPSNFSNINPDFKVNPMPFAAGGQAKIGIGGADTSYAPRLGLTGGNYGPLEMGAGTFAPASLPQAQPTAMLEQKYSNPFLPYKERFGETFTQGLTPIPKQTRIPITEGPVSIGINATPTSTQRGLQETSVAQGSIYATPQQLANLNSGVGGFAGQRTPVEQQALLAKMRQQGARMAGAQEQFFAQKREEQKALNIASDTARSIGVRPMDIMRATAATQPASTISAIRNQAYQYSQRLPMAGPASSAVSIFNKNLPVGGSISPFSRGGGLGLSGFALYEQQQAQKRMMGQAGPYSNSRAAANPQGPQPAQGYTSSLNQQQPFTLQPFNLTNYGYGA